MACAPPIRNRRETPASAAAAITTGSGFGHTAMTLATPAALAGIAVISSDDGSGIAAAWYVAADAIEREDALLHGDSGRDCHPPAARHLAAATTRMFAGRARIASRTAAGVLRPRAAFPSRVTSIGPSRRSSVRAYAGARFAPACGRRRRSGDPLLVAASRAVGR